MRILRRMIDGSVQWITVHPNGAGTKGTPVKLDAETGEVLAGMGGKFNGQHISAVPDGGRNEKVGASMKIAKEKYVSSNGNKSVSSNKPNSVNKTSNTKSFKTSKDILNFYSGNRISGEQISQQTANEIAKRYESLISKKDATQLSVNKEMKNVVKEEIEKQKQRNKQRESELSKTESPLRRKVRQRQEQENEDLLYFENLKRTNPQKYKELEEQIKARTRDIEISQNNRRALKDPVFAKQWKEERTRKAKEQAQKEQLAIQKSTIETSVKYGDKDSYKNLKQEYSNLEEKLKTANNVEKEKLINEFQLKLDKVKDKIGSTTGVTTTYERFEKRRRAKFESWWNGNHY